MSFTGRRWFPRRRPHPADLNNAGVPILPAPRPADPPLTSPPVESELQPLGGDDQHPSPHLSNIPTLLQLGFSVQEISALSGVPHALVELIAGQQHPAAIPAHPGLPPNLARARASQSSRVRRVAYAVIVLSAVNVCVTLAALVWHLPAFAAWGTGGALTLIAATFLLARHVSPPPRRPIRGQQR